MAGQTTLTRRKPKATYYPSQIDKDVKKTLKIGRSTGPRKYKTGAGKKEWSYENDIAFLDFLDKHPFKREGIQGFVKHIPADVDMIHSRLEERFEWLTSPENGDLALRDRAIKMAHRMRQVHSENMGIGSFIAIQRQKRLNGTIKIETASGDSQQVVALRRDQARTLEDHREIVGDPEHQFIPLLERGLFQCAAVVGEEEGVSLVCGAEVTPGCKQPWCNGHRAIYNTAATGPKNGGFKMKYVSK